MSVHWCCCWRQRLVLHELAAGAVALFVHRFVVVGKIVDLHKRLLSIVDKRVSSFGLLAQFAAMRQHIWLHIHCCRRQQSWRHIAYCISHIFTSFVCIGLFLGRGH